MEDKDSNQFVACLVREKLSLIETNLDDLQPQILAYTQQQLLDQGALDVWVTPIVMKKSRAANVLSVLCKPEDRNRFMEYILRETSTLGVRTTDWERFSLPRRFVTVSTLYGDVPVKIGHCEGKVINVHPEFDECAQIAKKFNIPVQEIIYEATKQCKQMISEKQTDTEIK